LELLTQNDAVYGDLVVDVQGPKGLDGGSGIAVVVVPEIRHGRRGGE